MEEKEFDPASEASPVGVPQAAAQATDRPRQERTTPATNGSSRPAPAAIVELPQDAVDALETIAKRRRISLEDALLQAIADESLLDEEAAGGSKILIEKPDKTMHEIQIG